MRLKLFSQSRALVFHFYADLTDPEYTQAIRQRNRGEFLAYLSRNTDACFSSQSLPSSM